MEYKYAVNSIDRLGQIRNTQHYTLERACEAYRMARGIRGIVHAELVRYAGDADVTLHEYDAPRPTIAPGLVSVQL